MKQLLVLAILMASLSFSSCDKDTKADDEALIQQYIQANGLNAIEAQDGLYYVIDVAGTGTQPSGVYSTVSVHYTGRRISDNFEFDSSLGGPAFSTQLTNVIKGWQYGIPYFKAGGTGKLLIPSHLAYGSQGAGSDIPPNTPIMFDINLISVQN